MALPQKEERTLLEAIRKGTAPSIIKRRASRGTIPVAADELLEILILLTKDPDPTCSEAAQATLGGWPEEKCVPLLADPQVSPEALAYFAAQPQVSERLVTAIAEHPKAGDEALAPLASRLTTEQVERLGGANARLEAMPQLAAGLLKRSDLPANLRTVLEGIHGKSAEALGKQPGDQKAEKGEERGRVSLMQKVGRMSVSDRIQLALKGSREERMLLIRDPAKVVSRAVLQSPKLSDSEVEAFASMKNVAEEVLRNIAANRQFVKNYTVVRQLVNNPRTPVDVSLHLINRLTNQDMKFLSLNRNIPDTLRALASKLHKQRTAARGGGH
ncbi:MAG: hypothetical protein ACE5IP_02405 [Terriglobia bacterium]